MIYSVILDTITGDKYVVNEELVQLLRKSTSNLQVIHARDTFVECQWVARHFNPQLN